MPRLDHIHLHVADGPGMVAFLGTVLGAEEGFRPPFEFPGHWLYLDGAPVIHISTSEAREGMGMVGHAAFGVYERELAEARIRSSGHPYRVTGIPGSDIGQFFVDGPEGLLLEVQFRRPA